jgi:hypothetical protein|tara:strand:- start:17476 stop:17694 length:219 start_codon:yes stop_codon:yes gene_type:complete
MPRYEVGIVIELPEGEAVDELEYIVDISHKMQEELGLKSIGQLVDHALRFAKEDYPHCRVELETIKEIQYLH